MNLRTITVGGRSYATQFPDPPPMANRPRAVLRARLIDELSGLALTARVGVRTSVEGLQPRWAGRGVVGLVGRPEPRFPLLDATATDLDIEVSAERFLTCTLSATLGPFNTGVGDPADFPDHFAAADLGDIAMHRAPVTFEGRTLQTAGLGRDPLAGVTVALIGIWTMPPGPDVDPDTIIEPADMLELRPGLYRDRIAGVDSLRVSALVIGAQAKTLLAPAGPGTDRVRVSDRLGLVVGDLLAIADGLPDRSEYIEITAIDGAPSAAEPATVTLAHPLRNAHFTATPAAPAQVPGGVVPTDPLLRDAIPGDTTVALTGIDPGVPDVGLVEIAGSGTPEYHVARHYRTLSGIDGDYRLPPLSRVARIRLEASRADLTSPVTADVAPDYARPGNRQDFVFPP